MTIAVGVGRGVGQRAVSTMRLRGSSGLGVLLGVVDDLSRRAWTQGRSVVVWITGLGLGAGPRGRGGRGGIGVSGIGVIVARSACEPI